MGSVWPDCDVYATGTYEVEDLDGDGKDDVIYKTYVGGDGTTETHVMLQRKSMKFVEAASCLTCHPSADVAADGTRLLITQDDCCCILSIGVQRFEGDSTAAVVAWQVPSSCHADPAEVTSITFTRDAKQRITGAEHTRADGKTERFRWRNKTFEKR